MFTIFLGLIVPRIILENYGSDANGMMNTVTQIFTYMALLEAGISQSARNQLFKPLHEDNRQEISCVMSAARSYFRRVTLLYLTAVIALSFLMPLALKTSINYWTVAIFIFAEGLINIVSFYFINTWSLFLSAGGKSYISIAFDTVSKCLIYAVKITLAIFKVNLVFIQIGAFAVSLLKLLGYFLYMRKKYPWIDYDINDKSYRLKDRNYYIITEVAWTIFSSTDMIVLSIFISTSLSSVYGIYNMVFVALSGLLNAVYNALNYNLGKAYQNGIEKYKKVHDLFNSIFLGAMTVLMCVSFILTIPFVKLYTAGIQDINYVYAHLPLCFCLIQMLSWSRYVAGNLSGIAGYAKPTSVISLIEAGINVVASLILVQFYDITGVLIATILALPLKVFYCNWLAEAKIMKRRPWKTLTIFGINWGTFGITVALFTWVFHIEVPTYGHFVLYGLGFSVLYACVIIVLNMLANPDLFVQIKTKLLKRRQPNE